MANIVVVFQRVEDATNVRNILVKRGFDVMAVCTTGTKAITLVEEFNDGIVICGYKFADMNYAELKQSIPPQFDMLLLASAERIAEGIEPGVIALQMPIKMVDLVSTVEMMYQNLIRRKKKAKLTPKKRSESEQKIIDEAKNILMEKNGLTEEEAHRYLQKNSMDSGNSIVETAYMVLSIMK